MKISQALVSVAVLAGAFAPVPVAAQSAGKVSEIIVYGNDPCPRSTDDNVVVCARKPEGERYRIPEKLRPNGTRQEREAWASKATQIQTMGATGINSCSPVGPGGYTGCLTQLIRNSKKERQEEQQAQTPDLGK
ncbi:hypothetical protein ABDK56_06000 [Sphingomonas sp. ASV193]|uniref:hypothetical protein n=1 Tax=Sphingomonas sp. ASV193 TaxID=3144405 RepID=UPI0032E8A2A3